MTSIGWVPDLTMRHPEETVRDGGTMWSLEVHPEGYWWRSRPHRLNTPPDPTPGRDKSRLYALAIASLGLFRALRRQYPEGRRP